MRIDLAKIDSQIRKLEELKRFVSDPETRALLETMVMNGDGGNSTSAEPEIPMRAAEQPKSRRFKAGTQIAAIADAAMKYEKPFSGYELATKMKEEGYKFHAERPGVAVTDVIRNSILKTGVIRVYRKGRGSEPMLFERVL